MEGEEESLKGRGVGEEEWSTRGSQGKERGRKQRNRDKDE